MSAALPPEAVDLRVDLGGLSLAHPLVDASGTFDLLEYARRFEGDYFRCFPYAAYVPKTVTADARTGNPPPRVTETPAGMINAIGLENPGIDVWIDGLHEWARLAAPVIVSVGGNAPEHYAAVVRRLEQHLADADPATVPRIAGYELNISCPNVSSGLQIGADPAATAAVVGAARAATGRLLLAKLTPNVADIVTVARAAVQAGADGLSLINTVKAMVLDRDTLRPFLGNRTGGLCGPAIKPIALRMVAEVAAGAAGRAARRHGRRHDRPGRARVHRLRRHGRGGRAPPTSPAWRRLSRILTELRLELAARGLSSPAAGAGPRALRVTRPAGRKVPACGADSPATVC